MGIRQILSRVFPLGFQENDVETPAPIDRSVQGFHRRSRRRGYPGSGLANCDGGRETACSAIADRSRVVCHLMVENSTRRRHLVDLDPHPWPRMSGPLRKAPRDHARISPTRTVWGATDYRAQPHREPGLQSRPGETPSVTIRQLAILSSVLEDAETGRKLATVFIPSTPNVRVGETRVLPFDLLTMTNWTVSDAMTFLMSGGTVSPSKIHFDQSVPD